MNNSTDIEMKAKGYNYAIQFKTINGDFGEEIYFTSTSEVGPFMRETFKDHEKAIISNVRKIS